MNRSRAIARGKYEWLCRSVGWRAVLVDQAVQRTAADPEPPCGKRFVATGDVKCGPHLVSIRRRTGRLVVGDRVGRGALFQRSRQVGFRQKVALAEQARALNNIAQLADVARPLPAAQSLFGRRSQTRDRTRKIAR